MSYLKLLVFLIAFAGVAYVGWWGSTLFLGTTVPAIMVSGVEDMHGYAQDISATVGISAPYKISRARITLDGKDLFNKEVGKRSFSFPLELKTKELSQGNHILSIEADGAPENEQRLARAISFYIDTLPLQAALTKNETDAKVLQGRTLHIAFQANKELKKAELKTFSNTYPCFLQSTRETIYECFVPVECEEVPKDYGYTIELLDWAGHSMNLDGTFQVVPFAFKKQTIKIAPEKLKAESEAGKEEQAFEAAIEELTKKSPCQKLWHGPFITPIELKEPQQITTEFGVIRTTQERGLKQHKALDVYTTPKSVVWATQDGIVVLKDRFAHSGNTVVIDHGFGFLSLFFHLDSFANIKVGDKIKKGSPIGTLGKTGYATGYHLHWEMRINNIPVDPLEWTKASF